MRLENLSTIPDALASLTRIFGTDYIPPERQYSDGADALPKLTLMDLGPIHSRALHAYLKSRGIPSSVAHKRLKEARYRTEHGREYFALALANDSSGLELRNPYFKGTLGSKDITLMAGTGADAYVFEGTFDFLTAEARRLIPDDASIIVLNSASMHERAVQAIRRLPVTHVDLFRDNDQAGKQLLSTFGESLPEITVNDRSSLYHEYNDLNAWHMNQLRQHSRRQ